MKLGICGFLLLFQNVNCRNRHPIYQKIEDLEDNYKTLTEKVERLQFDFEKLEERYEEEVKILKDFQTDSEYELKKIEKKLRVNQQEIDPKDYDYPPFGPSPDSSLSKGSSDNCVSVPKFEEFVNQIEPQLINKTEIFTQLEDLRDANDVLEHNLKKKIKLEFTKFNSAIQCFNENFRSAISIPKKDVSSFSGSVSNKPVMHKGSSNVKAVRNTSPLFTDCYGKLDKSFKNFYNVLTYFHRQEFEFKEFKQKFGTIDVSDLVTGTELFIEIDDMYDKIKSQDEEGIEK